jgi:hypothetical protein
MQHVTFALSKCTSFDVIGSPNRLDDGLEGVILTQVGVVLIAHECELAVRANISQHFPANDISVLANAVVLSTVGEFAGSLALGPTGPSRGREASWTFEISDYADRATGSIDFFEFHTGMDPNLSKWAISARLSWRSDPVGQSSGLQVEL